MFHLCIYGISNIYVTTIKEKVAITLKESKEEHISAFGGEKYKSGMI